MVQLVHERRRRSLCRCSRLTAGLLLVISVTLQSPQGCLAASRNRHETASRGLQKSSSSTHNLLFDVPPGGRSSSAMSSFIQRAAIASQETSDAEEALCALTSSSAEGVSRVGSLVKRQNDTTANDSDSEGQGPAAMSGSNADYSEAPIPVTAASGSSSSQLPGERSKSKAIANPSSTAMSGTTTTSTSTSSPDAANIASTTGKVKAIKNPKYVPNPKNPQFSQTTASAATTTTTATPTTSTAALVLPTPPSSTCAPQYKDTTSGAVYGPGLGNNVPPMSPRPSTFVKRNGPSLTLDGNPYRIVGPNVYWLGLDENVNSMVSYPDKGRIREAMAITVAMGGNTIRSHTLGISTGNSFSIWPTAYNNNDVAFDTIDYSIWAARNYGIRLVIPLTDNYAYYHGGKYDFIRWGGANTNDASQFYSNNNVIQIFKDYIALLLNHINVYTKVKLKDDPTILAWETGNELGGYFLGGGPPPTTWTTMIANYIKSIAPNHLVLDGTDGLTAYDGTTQNTGLAIAPVDMVTDHFYPALNWLLSKDAGILKSYPKNYLVGELDWTNTKGGDSLYSFLQIVESMAGSGSMIWSLFGHDGQCCNWIYHNDGYSLYYPNGNSNALQAQALLVTQHWYRMRGLTPPSSLPAVACPQPNLQL